MTADIAGLMQQVYDYFLGLFHPSDNTTSQPTYLLFQGIGTPMTPEMFKLHAADATYLPALAVEQISRLANRVAPVAGTFSPTGKVADDFYYMLLFGSQFAPESGNNTLFNALKAQALQKFDDQKLGSLLEPLAQFHPAYATPNDWYDPDAAANWTGYSVTSGEQTPPQDGGTPPPPPPRPRVLPDSWKWRVNPDVVQSIDKGRPWLQDRFFSQLNRADLSVQPAPSVQPAVSPAMTASTAEVSAIAESRAVTPSLAISLGGSANFSNALKSDHLFAGSATEVLKPGMIEVSPATEFHPVSPDPASPAIATRIARSDLIAAELVQVAQQGTEQPVTSSAMSMSFRYCLVSLDRPWLSQAYLNTPGWYVPGFQSAAFSAGTIAGNAGIFPAVPVACVVVRDLQITANWTDTDLSAAQHSMNFGPFLLDTPPGAQGSQAQAVTSPGLQIIGWICQVLPAVPPLATPAA